jgi:fatty acid desaturase
MEAETDFRVDRQRYPRQPMMAEVRRLSQVSNLRSAALIGFQWFIMIAAGWVAISSGHWAVYVLAAAIIAPRMQCLGVLMHDGAHYLLFTNRLANDVASDMLLAFPLGLSTTLYRHDHFVHHRFTNSDEDPDVILQKSDEDFRWPKTKRGCAWLIFRSIFGLNLPQMFHATKEWSPWANLFSPLGPKLPLYSRLLLVASTVGVYTVVVSTGMLVPMIFLVVIPGFTLLNLTNRIRVTSEHMRVPADHELNSTRTVVPTWLDRFFIAPFGVSYHIEHHLFPSVPGRNLGRLHNILMHDRNFSDHAHVTKSYLGVLGELMTPADERVTPVHGSGQHRPRPAVLSQAKAETEAVI